MQWWQQTAVHAVERGVVTVDLLDPNDPNTVIGVPGGTYWVMLFLDNESTLIAQYECADYAVSIFGRGAKQLTANDESQ